MNNQRRKELQSISDDLADLKERLEIVMEEEQEAFDNMPENMQEAERGQRMEEAVSSMEEAIDSIEGAIDSILEAQCND